MILSEILNSVDIISSVGNAGQKVIKGITNDSRNVKEGYIFVAVKGFLSDGHKFIPEAIANNAAALVFEDESNLTSDETSITNCVRIFVKDSRIALSQLSNIYYGEPSKKLKIIGITGTKGKTTTSYFIRNILRQSGLKVGLIGTIEILTEDSKIKSTLTTPESHQINAFLAHMLSEDCTHCVMEVSSHSLSLSRVYSIDFDCAVFTNITADHFDFHETFGSYREAKKILFDNLKENATAVCNSDDENWKYITADTHANVFDYGTSASAQFSISNISYDLDGTRFTLDIDGVSENFKTNLIGSFNAYNASAAIVTAYKLGLPIQQIKEGITTTPQVPGRFEVLTQKDKKVIIDYSHTAGSLEEALKAIKHLIKDDRKIHTVFGCGGNRDRQKRPIMGRIASELSDEVYVTSDNPRREDPYQIIEEILPGIENKIPKIIEDREEAIKTAICGSENNAVVLIAGKGHEDYQEINGVRNHFSDKEIALKYLEQCRN